jgi:hypothetical protein
MNLNLFAVLFVLTVGCRCAVIYIPGVTLDPMVIYQAQTAINRLQANLRATYGTAMQDSFDYYAKTWAANYFLKQLTQSEQLKQYSNIVSGQNNTVASTSSLIIGNNNQVSGSGNYVFTSNFNSAAAGGTGNDLVVDEWLVKMAMLNDFNLLLDYLNRPTAYIYRW